MRALLSRQTVRFVIAGSANTVVDFVVLNALTLAVGLPVIVANTIAVVIGITLSYFLQHYFVFRYPMRVSWTKFLQFFALTGFSSLVLQNLVIWGFELLFDTRFGNSLLLIPDGVARHAIELNIAKAFAVGIGLVWNFCFYRFVIFRTPRVDPEVEPDAAIAVGLETPPSRLDDDPR